MVSRLAGGLHLYGHDVPDTTGGKPSSAPAPDGETELFTVKQVSEQCGLPQPVIAQLVPRTWTAESGMYTRAQLNMAIRTATELRRHATDGGLTSQLLQREFICETPQLV